MKNYTDSNLLLNDFAISFPVQIGRPIFLMNESKSYFTKLFLISDCTLGILRFLGSFLKEIYLENEKSNEVLNSIFETLESKESHGLWSSMASDVLSHLDGKSSISILEDIMILYGVKSKSGKNIKIKRLNIKNTFTDINGKIQTLKISNTPLELIINFRNKYLGHGTVFSEKESKRIYELYEPIFIKMLEQCDFINKLVIIDAKTNSKINGYENSCSGKITIKTEEGSLYKINNIEQLSYQNLDPINLDNKKNILRIDKEEQKIIDTYPYFIAHPYQRALNEKEPYKRIHLLKETFLNYLKYLGLITASEYFNSNLKLKEVNRNFKQFLFRPQFGFWNAFMRETIMSLNENKHVWFVKELPEYYQKIERKNEAQKYDNNTGIGALINFRNHYLGHGMVPSIKKCIKLWDEHHIILKELLLKMDFCKNYSILSKDRNVFLRLMGDKITQINVSTKLHSNVALLNIKNEQISLMPFFVLPGEYFTKDISENAKLMVYEQNTGKRMVFFSPESISGETSGNVLEQFNLMIAEKDREKPIKSNELSKQKFQELVKENNKDFVGGLIKERKVIPEIYQERQDAEIALRSWVGALAGLFFVSAEAGSGKTNLLVEMNRQYNERGIDTLLLRGNRFAGDELWEEIQFRLNLAKDVNFSKSKAFGYTKDNPFIILIDGCNEHPNAEQLFDNILEFLNIHKGGHIKVVLSWRVNTKSELPSVKPEHESLVYVDGSDSSDEKNIIAKACHWLKPLNKIEVEGAWQMYTSNTKDKVRRKPNFTLEELTYKDRSLADQLDNPLLMRLFLELYNGKGLPKSRGGFTNIWTLYHQKLISQ